jgi:cellobiose epimerase
MPISQINFKKEVYDEFNNILNYWLKYSVDNKNGGFYGEVDGQNQPKITADKGIVLNSRILWTFSRAYIENKNPEYLKIAKRAFDYIKKYFWDSKNGGVYWSIKANGQPSETRKIIYGHSFAVYGASEYFRATASKPALLFAQDVFNAIVKHSYDTKMGGYIEAYGQDWSEINDYLLAKGDSRKSMNTHLHLMECFANLYRVDKSESVRFHLQHCIEIVLDKIIGKDNTRQTLFFTENWVPRSKGFSYGHDIESSWLIQESAEILGNEELTKKAKAKCIEMARSACEGLQSDDGMIYEFDPENAYSNSSRDWWVMAEAMVGFYNAYQNTGKAHYLEKSEKSWEFIKKYLIDKENGEWFGGVTPDHKVTGTSKITMWKCPYHNARACLEIYHRIAP